MKFFIEHYRNKKSIYTKKLSFERILHILFFLVFFLLLFTQTAIFIPSLHMAMIGEDSLNGTPIREEEFLYKEGTMELRLIGRKQCPSLKVLVNGDEQAVFLDDTVEIAVTDGDVVELDGSEVYENLAVEVAAVSNNIDMKYLDNRYMLKREILRLFKVRVS